MGSTVPDLGNSSGGNFLFNVPPQLEIEGFILGGLIMNKTTNTVRTISEVGIIAALGFVFDELQGIISKGVFINGGSIGFAMIAVLIIAFRRGGLAAIVTGLIMGLLDIATSAYIIHPAQLMLDYILPYALVGLVGFLKPIYDKAPNKGVKIVWLITATIIGGLLKFSSHYLAGVIYWADPENFAWNLNEMNPYLYCFIYNMAFIGPSILLTGGLLVAIECIAPRILENKAIVKDEKNKNVKALPYSISIASIGVGAFLFVYFLIKYIVSFSDYKDDGAYGYDFDPDMMVLFVVGLFIMVYGLISLFRTYKGNFSLVKYTAVLSLISLITYIYGLARLIRMYVKGKDPTLYWIWFGVALFVTLIMEALFIYLFIKSKKKEKSNI